MQEGIADFLSGFLTDSVGSFAPPSQSSLSVASRPFAPRGRAQDPILLKIRASHANGIVSAPCKQCRIGPEITPKFLRGNTVAKLKTLRDLFLDELKDVYNAEKQITKALPKMAKAASSDELRSAFKQHLTVTETQIERLEKVFKLIDEPAKGKKCAAMEGLLKEGAEMMDQDAEPAVMDAGLIGAAQRVEHYEIAAYGTLTSFARELGLEKAVALLEETLGEEKETDETLTEIASEINFEADEAEEEVEAK
jgi:ferritin-like metal-binding protein YciE